VTLDSKVQLYMNTLIRHQVRDNG